MLRLKTKFRITELKAKRKLCAPNLRQQRLKTKFRITELKGKITVPKLVHGVVVSQDQIPYNGIERSILFSVKFSSLLCLKTKFRITELKDFISCMYLCSLFGSQDQIPYNGIERQKRRDLGICSDESQDQIPYNGIESSYGVQELYSSNGLKTKFRITELKGRSTRKRIRIFLSLKTKFRITELKERQKTCL